MHFAARKYFVAIGVLLLTIQTWSATPKLIVAIAVDQFRYDYVERFRDQFTTNGFRLFLDHGTFMTFGHYDYVPTVTGPGHASFMSGSPPAMHGIIANEWFDKNTLKKIYCVGDSTVKGVGTTNDAGKMSPRNFIGSNFADQLRLHYGSKVVGISMKDRAAILPAGKKPAGAYWFETKTGNFISSTYYMTNLPRWVQEFNDRKRPSEFIGQTWNHFSDAQLYTLKDASEGEGRLHGETNSIFPHQVIGSTNGFDVIMPTPFGNQLLMEFAEASIDGEKLGQGAQPDLLCVSFSSLDSVGHTFGPYSQEVQDITVRLDAQLSKLFEYLDERIGLANVMMFLTADHGVAPTPEFAKELGLDSQRFNESAFITNLQARLEKRFGEGKYFLNTNFFTGSIFLDRATIAGKGLSIEQVAGFIREEALATGYFQACYSREQILDGRATDYLGDLVTRGYNPARGGDIVLVTTPFVMPGTGKTGTTHGSPYSYDTHVPILFYGTAFKPGRYADDFHITDIVPTVCSALHMDQPAQSIGKPCPSILSNYESD